MCTYDAFHPQMTKPEVDKLCTYNQAGGVVLRVVPPPDGLS